MKQLSTKDQNDTELTTIGHRTAFNNEQSPYRIVSYKRPLYDNLKQFKQENKQPYLLVCILLGAFIACCLV